MDPQFMQPGFYMQPAVSKRKHDPIFSRHKRGGVAPGTGVKSAAPTRPSAVPRPGVPRAF